METPSMLPPVPDPRINPLVFYFLPHEEAQHQLEHINESKVAEMTVACSVTLAVAILAVVLRFVSKTTKKAGYGADDWLMVVALVLFSTIIATVLICLEHFGAAKHLILSPNPVMLAKSVMLVETLYVPSMGFAKASTLVLYGRIFSFRGVRQILWAIGALVAANAFANIFVIVFQCRPVAGGWDPVVRLTAKCIDLDTAFIAISAFNVITDIALLIVPLPHLWRLNAPRGTKIQLTGLFAIGSFVSVVSIYRLPILKRLSLIDGSYDDVEPTIWTVIEISVGILCACAITYKPLVNAVFPCLHVRGSSRRSGGRHHGKAERLDSPHSPEAGALPSPSRQKKTPGVYTAAMGSIDAKSTLVTVTNLDSETSADDVEMESRGLVKEKGAIGYSSYHAGGRNLKTTTATSLTSHSDSTPA